MRSAATTVNWSGRAVSVEAAHVRWWAAHGPDEVAYALALGSLHHELFDRGAIGLTPDHTVAVSGQFIGRSPAPDSSVRSHRTPSSLWW